ncbi:hypothetical protein E1091_01565 [Micromonospora fluostatini]|uniref:DUF2637 domain-containing protein n=1 Tax=Micromonospora fluostatini TaxID=1629071 RepID=A0ABY2DLG4_9ACTN|nr:hypothetical protein E1091_01565 [Micromonospora fluostatini]
MKELESREKTVINSLLRVEPTGPTADSPAIPHEYQGGIDYHPTSPFAGIVELFSQVPTMVWIVLAATVITGTNMLLARYAVRRLRRVRTNSELERVDNRSPERKQIDQWTNILGGFGSIASLAMSMYALRGHAEGSILAWASFLVAAVLIELTIFVLVLRARENARERGEGGAEAKALWFVAAAFGVVLFLEPSPLFLRFLRLGIPLLVAYVNHLRIQAYCNDKPKTTSATDEIQGILKTVYHRILVLFRLAERADVKLSEQDRKRRVTRFVWLSYRAENAPFGWQKAIAAWRVDRHLVSLQERYGHEVYADALLQVAALAQSRKKMRDAATVEVTIWDVQNPLSGTGGGTQGGSDAGIVGGSTTGTGPDNGTARGGSEPPSGSGADQGGAGGPTTAPSGSGAGKVTVGEVETVRSSWTAEERAARRSLDAAQAHATEVGRAVYAETGQATAGMRAYFVAMAAADHMPVTGAQMREAVTGQSDKNGQGRNLLRKWKAELSADADRGMSADQANSAGEATQTGAS